MLFEVTFGNDISRPNPRETHSWNDRMLQRHFRDMLEQEFGDFGAAVLAQSFIGTAFGVNKRHLFRSEILQRFDRYRDRAGIPRSPSTGLGVFNAD
jgi:hypothetical protein